YAVILDRAFFVRDEADRPIRAAGAMMDVSQHHELQQELRQAQKMEAIGRLAGGVAHDFNNMLAVINGYSSLLVPQFPPDSPIRHSLDEIQRAGERAAGDDPRQCAACAPYTRTRRWVHATVDPTGPPAVPTEVRRRPLERAARAAAGARGPAPAGAFVGEERVPTCARMATPADVRTVHRLLVVIAALLAVQVGALAAAGIWGWVTLQRLEARLGTSGEQALASVERAASLAGELTQRQTNLSAGLAGAGRRSLEKLEAIRERRQRLDGVASGMIDKLEQTIRIQQLMADELIVMIELLGDSVRTAGNGLRPLPTQREGIGGSGEERKDAPE
ncbi:MAG: hypothetical protein ACK4N5_23400, partial [Myxococcales bacterium]